MFLHSFHPSPILLQVGSLTIHWYGLFLALGAVAALLVIRRLARQEHFADTKILDLFVILVIAGFLGARLYHVANEWAYYAANPGQILQIWNGGLAIHGGVIAGMITLWIYTRRHQWSFWKLTDIVALGLILAQAIGRWGNYFNQELFGRPTGLPWGIPIDPARRPATFADAEYFHPTFLYESLGSLLIFGALFLLFRRRAALRWMRPGMVTALYLLLSSLLRLGTELLRIDDVPIVAGLRLPLLASMIISAFALFGLVALKRQPHPYAHRTETPPPPQG